MLLRVSEIKLDIQTGADKGQDMGVLENNLM
jgi:hypothetical protein